VVDRLGSFEAVETTSTKSPSDSSRKDSQPREMTSDVWKVPADSVRAPLVDGLTFHVGTRAIELVLPSSWVPHRTNGQTRLVDQRARSAQASLSWSWSWRRFWPSLWSGRCTVKTPSAPGATRTPNLLIRSQTLYPIELRARNSQLSQRCLDRASRSLSQGCALPWAPANPGHERLAERRR
jgi:hypothetical protein